MAKAAATPSPRHPEDYRRYEQLLAATRDKQAVEHRDKAVKELAAEISGDEGRIYEFALARSGKVAETFDRQRAPQTESGQLSFGESSYLVLGENDRVRVTNATADHTRRWIDVDAENFAKVAFAHGVRDRDGRRILAVQEERKCSFWKAHKFLNGPTLEE